MIAKIFQPAKTAMQSGTAGGSHWVLELPPQRAQVVDPLMGWTGAGDTRNQVRMRFDDKAAAISYAQKHGLAYQVEEPKARKPVIRPGGYGDNFAYSRRQPWSH